MGQDTEKGNNHALIRLEARLATRNTLFCLTTNDPSKTSSLLGTPTTLETIQIASNIPIHIQFVSHHPTIQDLARFLMGNDPPEPQTQTPLHKRLFSPTCQIQRSDGPSNASTSESMHILEQTPHDDRANPRSPVIHALRRDDRLEQIPVLFPNIVHLRFPISVTG
ncbi:hypothetical protein AX14_003281 [Amanita brunnescens Koide BX004]|nr:hypothetical protein AX14_003281 [Amanita brunnescens Koide BX004]